MIGFTPEWVIDFIGIRSIGDIGGVEDAGVTLDHYRSKNRYRVQLPTSIDFYASDAAIFSSDEKLMPSENVRFTPGNLLQRSALAFSTSDTDASGVVEIIVRGKDRDEVDVQHAFNVMVKNGMVEGVEYLGGIYVEDAASEDELSLAEPDEDAASEGELSLTEPDTVVISRHPTIKSPDRVKMTEEFDVRVSLTEALMTREVVIESFNEKRAEITPEGKIGITLLLESPDQEEWEIDVVLSAPGFEYLNDSQSSVTLYKAGDSTKAVFKLRADNIPVPRRTRKLFVTFLHENTYLAEVTREIDVVNQEMAGISDVTLALAHTQGREERQPETKPASHVGSPDASVLRMSGTLSAAPLSLGFDFDSPDLTVMVLSGENVDNRHETEITLSSPYLDKSTFKLKDRYTEAELSKWLNIRYTKLFRDRTRKSGETIALMRGLGRDLYREFAPEVFKRAFWDLVDKLGTGFDSIQIVTNKPRLPWELMIPSRPDGSDEQDFIGLQYDVARWHRPLAHPTQSLPLTDVAVIAPRYQVEALPWQTSELQTLKGITGYRRVSGQYHAIEDFFSKSPPGIVHFAGHGSVKKYIGGTYGYAIRLEDGELDLDVWKGLIPKQAQTHPFFFFNACQVGLSHRDAHIVDGWAPAILKAGASGYIGALWSIADKGAAKFSIHFYRALGKELEKNSAVTVSSVLRETRKLFLKTGDPTYLSYIFYGDPNFQFVR
ncbi:MAG: CHAT domain-containing protein [Gammaproteobacteria bacterium]|nr:CHAT domain-containing protein [Gammaproteobacteria bacterium]NNJ84566.1 CHAT domain-containing protein [Gammaproteobacteria bacterium]